MLERPSGLEMLSVPGMPFWPEMLSALGTSSALSAMGRPFVRGMLSLQVAATVSYCVPLTFAPVWRFRPDQAQPRNPHCQWPPLERHPSLLDDFPFHSSSFSPDAP